MSRRRKLEMFTVEDKAKIVRLASLPFDQRPTLKALASRFGTTEKYVGQLISRSRAQRKQPRSIPADVLERISNG